MSDMTVPAAIPAMSDDFAPPTVILADATGLAFGNVLSIKKSDYAGSNLYKPFQVKALLMDDDGITSLVLKTNFSVLTQNFPSAPKSAITMQSWYPGCYSPGVYHFAVTVFNIHGEHSEDSLIVNLMA